MFGEEERPTPNMCYNAKESEPTLSSVFPELDAGGWSTRKPINENELYFRTVIGMSYRRHASGDRGTLSNLWVPLDSPISCFPYEFPSGIVIT